MKPFAIILLLFSANVYANKCPQLTGNYSCEVTNNKGVLVDKYEMNISQSKDIKNTEYFITYTDGSSVTLVTDNKPRITDSKQGEHYKRRRLVASCSRDILMIDEEAYVARDKQFTDIVSYYNGNSSYFSTGASSLLATHDGVLNYSENGEAKKKTIQERDTCRIL